jgi:hypothetical protein
MEAHVELSIKVRVESHERNRLAKDLQIECILFLGLQIECILSLGLQMKCILFLGLQTECIFSLGLQTECILFRPADRMCSLQACR